MEYNIKPMLLLTSITPNISFGTPVVIKNLIQHFEKQEVVIVSGKIWKSQENKIRRLPHTNYQFIYPKLGARGENLWRILSLAPYLFTSLWAVYKHRPSHILVVYPYYDSLLIGLVVSKLTNIPFSAYFLDLYMEQQSGGINLKFANWLQNNIFKLSANIFSLTDAMTAYFKDKYHKNIILLRHCFNAKIPNKISVFTVPNLIKIGYLGNINEDRLEGLRAITKLIDKNENLQLIYFSNTTKEYLIKNKIWPKKCQLKRVGDNELNSELKKCSTLYLPMAFYKLNGMDNLQGKTSFVTKTLDYFYAQRPIIVHAPTNYSTSVFFKKYNCGLVINSLNERKILEGINKIRSKELTKTFVSNGLKALRLFKGETIANQLKSTLF